MNPESPLPSSPEWLPDLTQRFRSVEDMSRPVVGELDVIYAIGKDDKALYAQRASSMLPSTRWTKLANGEFMDIAVTRDQIYAVRGDGKIYLQQIDTLTLNSSWGMPKSGAGIRSIAVDEHYMYAIRDGMLYRHQLHNLASDSDWELLSWVRPKQDAKSVRIEGRTLFLVKDDFKVYRQQLSDISKDNLWQVAASQAVTSVGISGNTVFALLAADDAVHSQSLQGMTDLSGWSVRLSSNAVMHDMHEIGDHTSGWLAITLPVDFFTTEHGDHVSQGVPDDAREGRDTYIGHSKDIVRTSATKSITSGAESSSDTNPHLANIKMAVRRANTSLSKDIERTYATSSNSSNASSSNTTNTTSASSSNSANTTSASSSNTTNTTNATSSSTTNATETANTNATTGSEGNATQSNVTEDVNNTAQVEPPPESQITDDDPDTTWQRDNSNDLANDGDENDIDDLFRINGSDQGGVTNPGISGIFKIYVSDPEQFTNHTDARNVCEAAIRYAGGANAEFVNITSVVVNLEKSETEDGRDFGAVDMSFRMNVFRNESESVVGKIKKANLTALQKKIQVAMTRRSLDCNIKLSRLDAQVVPDYMQNPADLRRVNASVEVKSNGGQQRMQDSNLTMQAPSPPAPSPPALEYEPED